MIEQPGVKEFPSLFEALKAGKTKYKLFEEYVHPALLASGAQAELDGRRIIAFVIDHGEFDVNINPEKFNIHGRKTSFASENGAFFFELQEGVRVTIVARSNISCFLILRWSGPSGI